MTGTGTGSLKLGAGRSIPAIASEMLRTPSLDSWMRYTETAAGAGQAGEVRATFLGVSTILLRDGKTAVLTDGFFSRPGLIRMAVGKIRPNKERIAAGLRLAGVDRLDAVFVNHSHFDHALDSATVAQLTDAWLIGSESTRQLSRGVGFRQERYILVEEDLPLQFGDFTLTAVHAEHSPGDLVPGTIDAPLEPPAKSADYRTGDCYSLFVKHRDNTLMIHASAGFIPGALAGRHADTVYLGIGVLGIQSDEYREQYWTETVVAVGASRVVPIHWDNFTRSLNRPLRPLPRPFDDVAKTLAWLQQRAERDGVAFSMPFTGGEVNPWPQL